MSVAIERIDAKQKVSGNRSIADQRGVLEGLERTADTSRRLVRATEAAIAACSPDGEAM